MVPTLTWGLSRSNLALATLVLLLLLQGVLPVSDEPRESIEFPSDADATAARPAVARRPPSRPRWKEPRRIAQTASCRWRDPGWSTARRSRSRTSRPAARRR